MDYVFKQSFGGKQALFVFSPEGIGLVWPDGLPAEPWGEELLKQIRAFVDLSVGTWAAQEGHEHTAVIEIVESRPDRVRVIYYGNGPPSWRRYSSRGDALTAALGAKDLNAEAGTMSVNDAVHRSIH